MLDWFWNYILVFLFVLTVVVFVHEFGHYLLARLNGVGVEIFSIGFGPELVGWTAKSGTRWKICAIPVGGYVKMCGDENAASMPQGGDAAAYQTPEERARSFGSKTLLQRASIVAAGPIFNLLFGFLLLAALFVVNGENRLSPVVGVVQPDSAAAEAGLQPGDRILSIDGKRVGTFQDIQRIVALNVGDEVELETQRDDERFFLSLRPRVALSTDAFGNDIKRPLIGIAADPDSFERVAHGPFSGMKKAAAETTNMIGMTLTAIRQIVTGSRSVDDLSGPLRIAKGAGQASQMGIGTVTFYIVLLSVNLGLFNLFPIPLFDGGHLLFYALEAVRGKPLGPKAQEYGFRFGLFLVLAIMVLATRNDLADLKVWDMIANLVS